ncbi:response regulator [Paraburkholderia graminis]|uniref:response regulator n=1 Tax=Paraburkholderia graminis TaxID=60548 RepID=UPI0035B523F7
MIRTIRRHWPETRILVLSAHAAEIRVAEALNAGAHGYVLKRSGSKKLLDAVDALRAGRSYFPSAIGLRTWRSRAVSEAFSMPTPVFAGCLRVASS